MIIFFSRCCSHGFFIRILFTHFSFVIEPNSLSSNGHQGVFERCWFLDHEWGICFSSTTKIPNYPLSSTTSWEDVQTKRSSWTKTVVLGVAHALLCVHWTCSHSNNASLWSTSPCVPIVSSASHRAQLKHSFLFRGDGVNIALIGSNVASMLLAHQLANDHNVVLLEQEAEVGMPVRHPGCVGDIELLTRYIPASHQHVLQLQHNPSIDAFGCRWEWVSKLLMIELTQLGIRVRTRTRVVEATRSDDNIRLALVSSLGDEVLHVDVVIDMRYGTEGPGTSRHKFDEQCCTTWQRPPMANAEGMVVLTEDLATPPSADLIIHRADGTSEIWWKFLTSWMPKRGALERMKGPLPDDVSFWSFEGSHNLACRVRDSVVSGCI